MHPLRIVEIGVDHPHGSMYRTTLMHHPGYELVGAWDANPDRARTLLTAEGIDVPVFERRDDLLLDTHADATLITLPNDETPAAVIASARAGVHVFAEKPSATTAAAFMPAYRAVHESRIRFLSGYLRRFSPAAVQIRQLIAEGILGELVSAQVTFMTTNAVLRNAAYLAGFAIEQVAGSGTLPEGDTSPSDRHWLFDHERSGGGIMHWLGVHWIDVLRFVTGDEFVSATSTLATRASETIDVEDVASVTLQSASGMQTTLSCAYVLPSGSDQIHVALQGTLGNVVWEGVGSEVRVESAHRAWRSAPARSFRFDSRDVPGYAGALGWEAFQRFHEAVVEDRELPMDAHDALQVLRVLDAIQQSGHDQRRVAIRS